MIAATRKQLNTAKEYGRFCERLAILGYAPHIYGDQDAQPQNPSVNRKTAPEQNDVTNPSNLPRRDRRTTPATASPKRAPTTNSPTMMIHA